jgi:hypothetical protein
MPENTYVVYFLVQNGVVKYCGITCDTDERKRAHAREKPPHVFEIQHERCSESSARRREGIYIRRYKLIEEGWNQINSAARIPGPHNYDPSLRERNLKRERGRQKRIKPIYSGQNTLFGLLTEADDG